MEDNGNTSNSTNDEDQHCDYNGSCMLPSSPTPASHINLPVDIPLGPAPTSTQDVPNKHDPTFTSSLNPPAEAQSKPAPPLGDTLQNTLHAFFNIPHQSPSAMNHTSPTLKHKKSLDEKTKLLVSKKRKPPGTSKSAQYEAQARAVADNGAPIDSDKFLRFKSKILKLDPCAKFFVGGDVCMVHHSKCGGVKKQKSL